MIKKIFIQFLILLCASSLFAGTVGKISGFITDEESGESLAGVNVFIEGTRLGASTDLEGEYFIINIPPGSYSVTASIVGYQTITVTGVRVNPDRTTKVGFNLKTEVMTGETIIIVAERPLIRRDATFTETVTSADEIENMPVTTVTEVMSKNAGFIVQGYTTDPDGNTDGSESIHVRGGRSNEIVYMIDGFYVKDPHSGGLGADVPSEGIQDLSIITGTFNAEYGEAMSGVVNIITKEGSPEYHASLRASTDQFGFSDYDNGTIRSDLSLSGPIPFLKNIANFYISADYLDTDTYLRKSESKAHDAQGNPIIRKHDFLTYEARERYTGKLVYKPLNNVKTIFGFNRFDEEQRLYNDLFKEIPDHVGIDYESSDLYNFTLSHTLSSRRFIMLR